MPNTTRGAPYPAPGADNNVPVDVYTLAQFFHENFGVTDLTTTARDTLTSGEKWDGRVIANTTLDRIQRYDAATNTWRTVIETSDLDDRLNTYQRRLARATLNAATFETISTTSGSAVDVHTSLACTFTVPNSGQVSVHLHGMTTGTSGSPEDAPIWSLRSGSSNVATSDRELAEATLNLLAPRVFLVIPITGLTPGASLTYKWAHRSAGPEFASFLYYGATYGPLLMEVHG